MRPPPNPFRIRASENIESDEAFLSLFAPGVLDMLSVDGLWNRIQQFYSTPGGGKTSLFRAFVPGTLVTLHHRQDEPDYKDMFKRMRNLGAVSNTGVNALGVMLSCAQDYATLEDLNVDSTVRRRLFNSLLNARIVISTFRNALTLVNLDFNQLDELTINVPEDSAFPKRFVNSNRPSELYDWACILEEQICTALHSFAPSAESLQEHNSLFAFWLLQPGCIKYSGKPISDKALLMLDDVHRLTLDQREILQDTFTTARPRIGIWLAERLEGVSPMRVLSAGSTVGREYSEPIVLENFWMNPSNQQRFINLAKGVADRRLRKYPHPKIEMDSFLDFLQDTIPSDEWQIVAEKMQRRLLDSQEIMARYPRQVNEAVARGGSPYEKAVILRSLEILIARSERRQQKSLDFGLPIDDVGDYTESSVKNAAEFFLSKEFKIPYFYGFHRLVTLASWNIEQFLSFAGDLYERMISTQNTRKNHVLDPKQQHNILERAAQFRWNDIANRVPDGRNVQRFLRALCEFAVQESSKPNAPYNPGVTGIGITSEDAARLSELSNRGKYPAHKQLWDYLFYCAAFNLVEVCPNRTQGQKSKTWTVLYLNRWLCAHYGLPIGYGGWRHRSIEDLCRWLPNNNATSREVT